MASFSNPGLRVGAPGNFAGSAPLGFAVGDPAFLESEASKVRAYWRGLEYGSDKFLGRVITGLWGDRGGPRGGLITGGELDTFHDGTGGQQKLVPFVRPQEEVQIGARRALGYLLGTGQLTYPIHRTFLSRLDQGDMRVPTAGVIKRPIVAQHAYRDAVRRFQPLERERDAIAQIFGNRGFTTHGKHFATGRGEQGHVRFVDTRSRRQAPISSKGFVARTGFLTGSATSGYTYSLVNFDKVFQRELVQINRLLAEGLAAEVAEIQKEKTKRRLTSTGRLVAATLSPQNRFPR